MLWATKAKYEKVLIFISPSKATLLARNKIKGLNKQTTLQM